MLVPAVMDITFDSLCNNVCDAASSGWQWYNSCFRSDCFACRGAVFLAWFIIGVSCLIDVWFMFNVWGLIIGVLQGWARGLSGIHFTTLRILRLDDNESETDGWYMKRVFGTHWKLIWAHVVEDLFEDCYISDSDANQMVRCVGLPRVSANSQEPLVVTSTDVNTQALKSLTSVAKERLRVRPHCTTHCQGAKVRDTQQGPVDRLPCRFHSIIIRDNPSL